MTAPVMPRGSEATLRLSPRKRSVLIDLISSRLMTMTAIEREELFVRDALREMLDDLKAAKIRR